MILFQMDNTPKTRSSTRKRHEPTPKLSERKKKLFSDESSSGSKRQIFASSRPIAEEAEDSDLGPMSPLQFSADGSPGILFYLYLFLCFCEHSADAKLSP